jgi:hypothetical protein
MSTVRVMRGAGPAIPLKGLAPTLSYQTAMLELRSDGMDVRGHAARLTKGTA